MQKVAKFYEWGTAVEASPEWALVYYHRAICAGSWMATLGYARVLQERGEFEQCDAVLEDGVRLGFIPSYFWLAWYRYKRSPNRKTRFAVLPLMQRAADEGHPFAKYILGRWMARGELGLRNIPRGFRMFREFLRHHREAADETS